MITSLSPNNEAFLANMDRLQRTLSEASRQMSSGKRVNEASDAPNDLDTILQLRADESHNTQVQTNLTVAQADANAADSALSSATKLLDRAMVLATQGASFTTDATGRQSIALEIESLQEQMTAIANTAVQGRYIFGGDKDTTPPYAVDLTATSGVTQLTNSAATRQVENPAGGSFAVSKTAQEIFDRQDPDPDPTADPQVTTPSANNVFAALNNLRLSLLANDTTKINAANTSLQLASDHLNASLAFYGTVENRITDATNYSSSYNVRLKTELSQEQDADITTAALAITQANTQLQAAFQMQAKMPRTTLFDFMG